jgi:hypothetical protein
MTRMLLLAVAAICISGSVVCAYLARPQVPATLEAVNSLYEVGEIGQGETKSVEFELVNHFPRNVEIKEVIPTCACTNVELTKKMLAPGEKSVVKANWRTGGTRGPRYTDITVLYTPDGGTQEGILLHIQGTVAPDILYSPERFEFERETPATRSVVFTPGRMAGVNLKKAWCTHRAFSVKFSKESKELVVNFDPSKWTIDDNNLAPGSVGEVMVETSSPNEPVCRIPLIVRGKASKN